MNHHCLVTTSPTRRLPDFLLGSGNELIPQSTTTAPGLTQSRLTSSGLPTATTRMSAVRQTPARPAVLLWQTVTVAWFHFSNCRTGCRDCLAELQSHLGDWSADYLAPAHHHRVAARHRHARLLDKLHAAVWSAGQETGGEIARGHAALVDSAQTINVLQ